MVTEAKRPAEAIVVRDPHTKQWLPGTPSPNPAGRPKVPAWLRADEDELLMLQRDAALRGLIRQAHPDDPDNRAKDVLVPVAIKDRLTVSDMLLDRIRGRAPSSDHENDDNKERDRVITMLAEIATTAVARGVKK